MNDLTDLITKAILADMDHRKQYGYSCFEEPKKEEDLDFEDIFEKELRRNDNEG